MAEGLPGHLHRLIPRSHGPYIYRPPPKAVIGAMLANHPHSAFARFRRKLVSSLAHHQSSFLQTGTSRNPGIVQTGIALGRADLHVQDCLRVLGSILDSGIVRLTPPMLPDGLYNRAQMGIMITLSS